jgi:hypothetical protein
MRQCHDPNCLICHPGRYGDFVMIGLMFVLLFTVLACVRGCG